MITPNNFTPRWQVKNAKNGDVMGIFEDGNTAKAFSAAMPNTEVEPYHLLDEIGELKLGSKGVIFFNEMSLEYLVKNSLNMNPSRDDTQPIYVRITISPESRDVFEEEGQEDD